MRYVEGVDLETRLRGGPLTPRESRASPGQVASALDAAHEAGLVHRDVKPANMLIASGKGVDRDDHAYLTDFGLTKHRGSQTGLTRAGGFIGTLEYIAPEQIEGKAVDGRADQYALAAIAVACLTGEPPYPRDRTWPSSTPTSTTRRHRCTTVVRSCLPRSMPSSPGAWPSGPTSAIPTARPSSMTCARHSGSPKRRPDRGRWPSATVACPSDRAPRPRRPRGCRGLRSGIRRRVVAESRPISRPRGDLALGIGRCFADRRRLPERRRGRTRSALPTELTSACARGSYAIVQGRQDGYPSPLERRVPARSKPGREDGPRPPVQVGRVGRRTGARGFVNFVGSAGHVKDGDCATSIDALGRWEMGGADNRRDPVLRRRPRRVMRSSYWSYDGRDVVVKVVNKRATPLLFVPSSRSTRSSSPVTAMTLRCGSCGEENPPALGSASPARLHFRRPRAPASRAGS